MKTQNTLLLAAAAVTLLNFQSCSKYEDGPAFSIRTKNSRLVGEWEVVKIDGQNSNAYFGPEYTYYFEFEEPAEAITKGQACVLYDQDRVLGGGIIKQKLN